MKYTLSFSYILTYFAIGLSINNHIFLSLIAYFVSATMLGLVIFKTKFTRSSNRFLLLTLALLYTILLVIFAKNISGISYSLLIATFWQACYSLLYLHVFINIDFQTKISLTKLVTGMNGLLITLLLCAKLYFTLRNISLNILAGYLSVIIILSIFSLVLISQTLLSYTKCIN